MKTRRNVPLLFHDHFRIPHSRKGKSNCTATVGNTVHLGFVSASTTSNIQGLCFKELNVIYFLLFVFCIQYIRHPYFFERLLMCVVF